MPEREINNFSEQREKARKRITNLFVTINEQLQKHPNPSAVLENEQYKEFDFKAQFAIQAMIENPAFVPREEHLKNLEKMAQAILTSFENGSQTVN